MRNFLFAIALLFILSSCHRPVALFQRTPHPAAARLAINPPAPHAYDILLDSTGLINEPISENVASENPVASRVSQPTQATSVRVQRRMHQITLALAASTHRQTAHQPDPKPKKKLKLGNRIRQGLGLPLRKELNWWQRISWKLKASVIIILVAVVFAILHVTILAIIFGLLGAFLMISGLRKSFKVRRPWL